MFDPNFYIIRKRFAWVKKKKRRKDPERKITTNKESIEVLARGVFHFDSGGILGVKEIRGKSSEDSKEKI